MEVILITAFCVAALVVAHRVGEIGPDRARTGAWKSAAAACRLEQVVTKERLGVRVLEATRGPLSIRLRSLSGTVSGWGGTRISVMGLPPLLSISPAGDAQGEADDVAVGDPDFDRATRVHGETLEIQALLDPGTRAHLQKLLSTRDGGLGSSHRLVSIGGGALVVDCWDPPIATRAERLTAALEEALTLAERLVAPDALEERLAESVRTEPTRNVRFRSLQMLLSERPDHPVTHSAARAALASDDDEIRLVAALALGAEGLATLRAIVRSATRTDDVSAKAVTALRDDLDVDEVQGAFSEAVALGRFSTAAACFEVICHRGAPHPELPGVILATASSAIVLPVVRALGLRRTAEAEPALVGALKHANIDVRLAAIDSLGRVGTAEAVPALRHVEDQMRFEGEHVRAVNAAIASIQARLLSADHGQLALTQPAGELSLAEDARGRVSRDEER